MESGSASIVALGKGLGITIGAAVLGAAIMTMFRPPKNKWEVFFQGTAAIAGSLLFGRTALIAVDYYTPFSVMPEAVYGVIGALSWGLFGMLAGLRDTIKEHGLQNTLKLLRKK